MIDDNIIKNISNKNQLTEEDEFMPTAETPSLPRSLISAGDSKDGLVSWQFMPSLRGFH